MKDHLSAQAVLETKTTRTDEGSSVCTGCSRNKNNKNR